jgi:pyruvate-formate lyase
MAKNKAPKYGRDDDAADALAKQVMDLWCGETWKHRPVPPAASSGPAC